mgnify:CR=1 FL=1
MLDKLHFVADYEGRSANSQILILIRDCIEAYEQKHGEIEITISGVSKKEGAKESDTRQSG